MNTRFWCLPIAALLVLGVYESASAAGKAGHETREAAAFGKALEEHGAKNPQENPAVSLPVNGTDAAVASLGGTYFEMTAPASSGAIDSSPSKEWAIFDGADGRTSVALRHTKTDCNRW